MAKLVERLKQRWQQFQEAWSQRTGSVPAWLALSGGLVVGGTVGLLAGASGEWTGALIGLLGVALGGVVAAVANFALERERRKGQLAMATWPERVRAHQEAFAIAHRVLINIHRSEEKADLLKRGDEFWTENCLYLTLDARGAFIRMLSAAHHYNRGTPDLKLWQIIEDCPRILLQSARVDISDEMLSELRRVHEQQSKKG